MLNPQQGVWHLIGIFKMFDELHYKNYEIKQEAFLGTSQIIKGCAELEIYLEIIVLEL